MSPRWARHAVLGFVFGLCVFALATVVAEPFASALIWPFGIALKLFGVHDGRVFLGIPATVLFWAALLFGVLELVERGRLKRSTRVGRPGGSVAR